MKTVQVCRHYINITYKPIKFIIVPTLFGVFDIIAIYRQTQHQLPRCPQIFTGTAPSREFVLGGISQTLHSPYIIQPERYKRKSNKPINRIVREQCVHYSRIQDVNRLTFSQLFSPLNFGINTANNLIAPRVWFSLYRRGLYTLGVYTQLIGSLPRAKHLPSSLSFLLNLIYCNFGSLEIRTLHFSHAQLSPLKSLIKVFLNICNCRIKHCKYQ